MDTETKTMDKPLIQIDNEIREMTDDEYAAYLELTKDVQPLGTANDD